MVTSAAINWMPIRTTWHTFKLSQYIKDAGQTTILAIIRQAIKASIPAAVISSIKLYHQTVYAFRYNKNWKAKETYCGAQGYYQKYGIKSWHYALKSNGSTEYIDGSYSLYPIP